MNQTNKILLILVTVVSLGVGISYFLSNKETKTLTEVTTIPPPPPIQISVSSTSVSTTKVQVPANLPTPSLTPQNETINWPMYSNLQFAFKISYPQDWDDQELSKGVRIKNYKNIFELKDKIREVQIRVLENENPKQRDIELWLKEDFLPGYFANATSKKIIQISGLKAVKMQGFGSGKKNDIYIARGIDIISIVYEIAPDYDEKYNKIIQTLKFTAFDAKAYAELLKKEAASIVGEDVGTNGVWDYIQSYIDKTYTNSEKTRVALYQYTKAVQEFLIESRDKQASINNSNEMSRASDCLRYIHGPEEYYTIISLLEAEILNTDARSYANIRADGQLGGQIFSSTPQSQLKFQCDFNPDAMSN